MTRPEFDICIQTLSRRLYQIAFRFLKSREDAEDAVQEVFIRLWSKKEKLDEYDSVEALATTAIKNICIDQLRKQRTVRIDENNIQTTVYLNDPSPDERLEKIETVQILDNIIDKLPDIYKEIIILREIDGCSYEEIAIKTNQNINTLRVNLSRARKMIREKYIQCKYEYSGSKKAAGEIL